jgi:serine/threonine protein kinase
VHYCHKRGVFHRDLKPENILLSEDRTCISLSDFGLSTTESVSSDFGWGTSHYMSPECIQEKITYGSYSTCHNDIWSLGVVLANMISGCNPWPYATMKDETFATYLRNNNILQQTLPGISDGATAILKRIFDLNPLSRISLPELRNEILKLDTFFLPEEVTLTPINKVKFPEHHNKVDLLTTNINHACISQLNSEEHYYFKSPKIDEDDFLEVVSCIPSEFSVMLVADTGSVNSNQSEGPITPVTKAADPGMEVPDFELLDDVVNGFISMRVANAEIVGTQKLIC